MLESFLQSYCERRFDRCSRLNTRRGHGQLLSPQEVAAERPRREIWLLTTHGPCRPRTAAKLIRFTEGLLLEFGDSATFDEGQNEEGSGPALCSRKKIKQHESPSAARLLWTRRSFAISLRSTRQTCLRDPRPSFL